MNKKGRPGGIHGALDAMQAMIITAYKDYDALVRVVRALSAHALCFVHVDARSAITPQQVAALDGMPNVRAIRRFRVNWGSIDHLRALLALCRMALEDERVTYLHLMSAQDFPLLPARDFLSRFEGETRIFMQMLRTADDPELTHRYAHYHFMHWLNYRDPSEWAQNWVGRIDRWQDALHIHRKISLPYKGLVWMSMPRDAAQYALCAKPSRKLLRKLALTYIPEEFFFQNVFPGTPFESRIVDAQLHFSIWDQPERGLPAVLDLGDLERMDASGCAFARKVEADSPLFDVLLTRWES